MTKPPTAQVPRVSLAERRQLRRGELLDAAIDVIRREGADVTMEEMATAGGISKPILYRHFVDRDGLVAAVTEAALVEIGDASSTTRSARRGRTRPPHSIRATIDAFFEYIERDPQLYRFIVDSDAKRGNAGDGRRSPSASPSASPTRSREGLVDRGHDPSPATIWGRAIVGMVQTTAAWWIGGAEVIAAVAVDTLTDLAWVGIVGTVSEPSAPARVVADRRRQRAVASGCRALAASPCRSHGAAQPRRADLVRRRSQGVRDATPITTTTIASASGARHRRESSTSSSRPTRSASSSRPTWAAAAGSASASTSATSTGTRSASSSRTPTGGSRRSD